MARKNTRFGRGSLRTQLYRQGNDLLNVTRSTGNSQLIQGVQNLCDLFRKEPGRYLESIIPEARRVAFPLIDLLGQREVQKALAPNVEKYLRGGLSEFISTARQIRDGQERARTNKGMLLEYNAKIDERYSNCEGTGLILKRLSDILGGNAKNDQGKRIYLWKDRIEQANALLETLRENTLEYYGSDPSEIDTAKRIYLDAQEALHIGIKMNSYLNRKNNKYKTANNIDSPFALLDRDWIRPPVSQVVPVSPVVPVTQVEKVNRGYFSNLLEDNFLVVERLSGYMDRIVPAVRGFASAINRMTARATSYITSL
jgi:hypothetical protein